MKFLLDTNAVIGLLAGKPPLLRGVGQPLPSEVGISSIVAYELFFGAYKSKRVAQNVAQVEMVQFAVLEFDKDDARQAGYIRADLAVMGAPIGPYDVLIAGQARARGLTLITHNTAEFSRVQGLQIDDWEI